MENSPTRPVTPPIAPVRQPRSLFTRLSGIFARAPHGGERGAVGPAAGSDTEAELERYVETVLAATDRGVLWIDAGQLIQPRQSRAALEILDAAALTGFNLVDVIAPHVPPAVVDSVREFVDRLFDPALTESAAIETNPLGRAEFLIARADGGFTTKFLSFKFNRIVDGARIHGAVVIVADETEFATLAQEFYAVEFANEARDAMRGGIAHLDAAAAAKIATEIERDCDAIAAIMRPELFGDVGRSTRLKQQFPEVDRLLERIAQAARAYGIENIARRSQAFALAVDGLHAHPMLTGDDFMTVRLHLANLRSDAAQLCESSDRPDAPGRSISPAPSDGDAFYDELDRSVRSIAARLRKDVRIDRTSFDLARLSPELRSAVEGAVYELAHHSVSVMIEPAADRLRAGKPATATIRLANAPASTAEEFRFTFADDGRGIDAESLRRMLVRQGVLSVGEALECEDAEVIGFIFDPNFSYDDDLRSNGLHSVKSRIVYESGGRIDVASIPGRSCQFSCALPLVGRALAVRS